jgi:phage gpG-like protein
MAGIVRIKVDMTDVSKKMGMVQQNLHRGLLVAVAEWLRFIIRQAFETQSSPEGIPWKPLTAAYAARKKGGLRILELTGALFASADKSIIITGNRVSASSSLPYSGIHQFGGTIHIPDIFPKKAKALFFMAGGKNVFAKKVKAHDVRMPARPYLPSPEFAGKEAAMIVDEKIAAIIKEAGAGPA